MSDFFSILTALLTFDWLRSNRSGPTMTGKQFNEMWNAGLDRWAAADRFPCRWCDDNVHETGYMTGVWVHVKTDKTISGPSKWIDRPHAAVPILTAHDPRVEDDEDEGPLGMNYYVNSLTMAEAIVIIESHIPSITDELDENLNGPRDEEGEYIGDQRVCACGVPIVGYYDYVEHLVATMRALIDQPPGAVS